MKTRILPYLMIAYLGLLATTAMAQFPIEQLLPMLKDRTTFNIKTDLWDAQWIEVPGAPPTDYGVYYFRKDILLSVKPIKYKVHVTGDTRYKLFVNGQLVSMGPARSDSKHWNYETVDLANYMVAGQNIVAAQVWNEGKFNPISNASIRTGFLLMGEDEAKVLNTDPSWKCTQDFSYYPIRQQVQGYYALGAGEGVDMRKHISNWMSSEADLSKWSNAKGFDLGTPHDASFGTGVYMTHLLQPSPLPQLERMHQRFVSVRRNGGLKLPEAFPKESKDITIAEGSSLDILLDQQELTNAFFHLKFSKGINAEITITYSESLYSDEKALCKGNRNEVDGKFIYGRNDRLVSNGQFNQEFTTLDWRTYRYVNLHIETRNEPLILHDTFGTFIGYPFKLNSTFDTDNVELKKMLEVGWRTARLCAQETYVDCPYYEQLQYLGDTRIQALISLYNSGDDTLVKNFLRQADLSRNAEGVTMGRAPSELSQYITPYALCYVYALHDYMRYGSDKELVEYLTPGAEQILHYFSKYQQADGRIKGLPGWNFSDWVDAPGWQLGVAQAGSDGCGILMDLQLLLAFQLMTDIEQNRGNTFLAGKYIKKADQLKETIKRAYWDEERGLFANRIEKDIFSQHGNAMAIICNLVQGEEALQLAQKLVEDKTLSPCSVYYKFYLHEALTKAGLGNQFLSWLDIWRENLAYGMTTWGETSNIDTTRSDCHAWGSSLNIEFYRIILGIDSDAPNFSKVRIKPHLGNLKQIGGSIPHPRGNISVRYKMSGRSLQADITLPTGVTGSFEWNGTIYPLHEALNALHINEPDK